MIDRNIEQRVLKLTFSRAEKRNALTHSAYGQLATALGEASDDDDIDCIVISGAGGNFTAGHDLAELARLQPLEVGPAPEDWPVNQFVLALADCRKPVIAAVKGSAIGIGLTMLLHCDLVYASRRSRFAAPFVALGLVPEAASSLLLPAQVGLHRANEILLLGESFDAAEALHMGLVNALFEDADLEQEVMIRARKICNADKEAVSMTKTLVRTSRQSLVACLLRESACFAERLDKIVTSASRSG